MKSIGIGIGFAFAAAVWILVGALTSGEAKMNSSELQGVHVDRVAPYDPDAHTLKVKVVAPRARSIEVFAISNFEMIADGDHRCAFDSASVQGIKGGVAVQLSGKLDVDAKEVKVRAVVLLNGQKLQVACAFRQRTAEERAKLNPDVRWEYLTSEVATADAGAAESKPSK